VAAGVNLKSMNPHFGDFGVSAKSWLFLTMNSTKEGTFTYKGLNICSYQSWQH
jgi:hypothetical protein